MSAYLLMVLSRQTHCELWCRYPIHILIYSCYCDSRILFEFKFIIFFFTPLRKASVCIPKTLWCHSTRRKWWNTSSNWRHRHNPNPNPRTNISSSKRPSRNQKPRFSEVSARVAITTYSDQRRNGRMRTTKGLGYVERILRHRPTHLDERYSRSSFVRDDVLRRKSEFEMNL